MSKLLQFMALLLHLSVSICNTSSKADEHFEWREKKFALVLTELQNSLHENIPDLEAIVDTAHRFNPGAMDLHASPELCHAYFNQALLYLFGKKGIQESKEKVYFLFIQRLRAALNTRYYKAYQFNALDIPLLDMIQTVSMQLYHGVHIQTYLDSLWQNIASHGGYDINSRGIDKKRLIPLNNEESSREHLIEVRSRLKNLLPIYEGIKTGKSLLSVKFKEKTKDTLFGGVTWLSFDPASMGNIPYVKYRVKRQGDEHLLTYIRMPTPTLNSRCSEM